MKKVITSLFIMIGIGAFAQERSATSSNNASQSPQRSGSSSTQTKTTEATPLPYDVNDKYMGRKDEFLNSMIVTELPADFPVYDKQWGVKEYNAVIDAYFMTHMDILKERVKQKVQYQIDKQKTK